MKTKQALLVLIILVVVALFWFPQRSENKKEVIVFYAATFSNMMESIKTENQDFLLKTEVSGSQMAIRKITELGREADIVMSADKDLFKTIGGETFRSRIDFARDEIVLGVGLRATQVDAAEANWVDVLKSPDVTLARVDENLGPIGYRTLLTWQLKEKLGYKGLEQLLKDKTEKVVDHVSSIAALLKAGDVDYGFLYKSTALKNDIRYIKLEKEINLGSPDIDYSNAQTTFIKIESGKQKTVTAKGEAIICSLSIVNECPNKENAILFIKQWLKKYSNKLQEHGFTEMTPMFYGEEKDYVPMSEFVKYGGEF